MGILRSLGALARALGPVVSSSSKEAKWHLQHQTLLEKKHLSNKHFSNKHFSKKHFSNKHFSKKLFFLMPSQICKINKCIF